MSAKFQKTISFGDEQYLLDFVVSKINDKISTVARVSRKLQGNMYSRTSSDFAEQGLITEVKRFSAKALQAHKDWIEENKEAILTRAQAHYA